MAESPQQLTNVRPVGVDDIGAITRFVGRLPEGDRTFLKESVEETTVARWAADDRVQRWVAVGPDGEPQAMLAIVPGALWSSHVGELRLVVGQDHRRKGLGRKLARYGLAEAVRLGLSKIMVEVAADKEGDIAMFTSIGFEPEALLRDHIRDRDGDLHDLLLLSHEVTARAGGMDVIGLGGEVGMEDVA